MKKVIEDVILEFLGNKPILIIRTISEIHICKTRKDILELRGWFFREEIKEIIKKVKKKKRKFKEILNFLKEYEGYMVPQPPL